MKDVTDWKGNIIKEGDTVIIVSTISKILMSTGMVMIDMSKEGKGSRILGNLPKANTKQSLRWIKLGEMSIVKLFDKLFFNFKIKDRIYNIDMTTFNFTKNDGDILCIKGVSDDRDIYYENYFKA